MSRFSGFLEPEMQVAVVTYVAFMFSSSIFFFLVEITFASLFASCRQTVWQVLRGDRTQNSICLAPLRGCFWALERRCMKWEGFPYDVFFYLGTSPLLRGITEFIEKATNDTIIFLLRSTFLEWARNPIIEKGRKSCKIDCP